MTLKKIKRTNAPRTCLYCGQKLTEKTRWVTLDITEAEAGDQRQSHRLWPLSKVQGSQRAVRAEAGLRDDWP